MPATEEFNIVSAMTDGEPRQQLADPIQVRLKRFPQLTAVELDLWSRFQREDTALESPYFHPQFTRAVAAVRSDVEVAVLCQANEPVGFFPFQRRRGVLAVPVGDRISDYHGVICRRQLSFDAVSLLRGCGLLAWDFDHVPCAQQAFQPFRRLTDQSPYLDLSGGFDSYRQQLSKSGLKQLRYTSRKARKLQREAGAIRFEADCKDLEILNTLLQWKSKQYLRTQVPNVLAYSWVTCVLKQILAESDSSFAGVLSALFVNDQPVSIHFGMRAERVMHWWFNAYDPRFSVYSPGLILLTEFAQAAESLGIQKIDMGRGLAPYKRRAMTAASEVAEGSVDLRPVVRRLRAQWRCTREQIRSSRLHGSARVLGRSLRRFREWLEWE